MIFNIPKLISYISSLITLRPGDMIITGSPQGNGSHWGRFLRDGDVMESTITGLGSQRNEVRGPLPSLTESTPPELRLPEPAVLRPQRGWGAAGLHPKRENNDGGARLGGGVHRAVPAPAQTC